ncbi:MAG: hypothetical protein HYT70_03855 [Candidatus Aenigmarchaeota archaeon]|nr:hypothetical protein [Candidatus Aenigmarchaeota archaeon]
MKSQVALEYLFVIGLVTMIILPIFYFSTTNSLDSVRVSQAQDTVDALAKASDYVYSLGVGSSEKISIIIPDGVLESSVQNKTILLRLQLSSGVSDMKAVTKANVTGSVPNATGTYNVIVNMTGSYVEIRGSG